MKSIMFYSVSQLSAIALMHGIRRNGVPSFSPHKIVAMSAAKRGSMHIMLKGIEEGVLCSETGFQGRWMWTELSMLAAKRGSNHFEVRPGQDSAKQKK